MRPVTFYLLLTSIILSLLKPVVSFSADGEALFETKCLSCHSKKGEVRIVAPVKYAAIQWERFFKKEKHRRKKEISHLMSQQEKNKIMQYLVNHAADSDRPIAAGVK